MCNGGDGIMMMMYDVAWKKVPRSSLAIFAN
jgi:hypothetical protein